jgi:hypothetical protein
MVNGAGSSSSSGGGSGGGGGGGGGRSAHPAWRQPQGAPGGAHVPSAGRHGSAGGLGCPHPPFRPPPTRAPPLPPAAHLVGKPWTREVLEGALALLPADIRLSDTAPGGRIEYRRSLAASFLFKFFAHVCVGLEALGLAQVGAGAGAGRRRMATGACSWPCRAALALGCCAGPGRATRPGPGPARPPVLPSRHATSLSPRRAACHHQQGVPAPPPFLPASNPPPRRSPCRRTSSRRRRSTTGRGRAACSSTRLPCRGAWWASRTGTWRRICRCSAAGALLGGGAGCCVRENL